MRIGFECSEGGDGQQHGGHRGGHLL